ncbi:MAG: histidine kinase [Magnetospirillum sp.]|nr:histidine kinase [Magnetospirillum sp.]
MANGLANRSEPEQGAIAPHGGKSRLPRPRLLLALITLTTMLGGLGGLATLTWFDHQATLTDWTADLGLSSRLIESHAASILKVAHANLVMVSEHFDGRPLGKLRDSAADREWLDGVMGEIPYAQAICIHDDKGDLVLTSDRQGLFAPNATGREYMTLALAQPGRTMMSAVTIGRGGLGRLIIFSRAMIDHTGRVRGVAEILIKADYFVDFYRDLQPEPGSLFLIARNDGGLVARYPMPDASFTHFDISKPPFTEFNKAVTGSYRAVSVIDGVERLISYRNLPQQGLVVTAGLPVDSVFRDWTMRTQRNVTLFAANMLLLLGLAALANESLRQERRLLQSGERKTRELTNALAEKDVLFQEVHHRVKNNLQVISSLLTMQSLHVTDDKVRETLKDALDRIHSMGLVHQTLYERNLAASVDLGTYFGKLAEALANSYSSGKGGVTVEVEVEGTLDLERAVPLGMLANEVLSNALKHAFSDGRRGTIWVTLMREAGEWHFSVRDNGVGMPDKPGRGIGVGLIRALARQLGGRSHIIVDEGTVVSVTFPA